MIYYVNAKAERDGNGTACRQKGPDAQGKHQEKGPQQRDKEIAGRPVPCRTDCLENRLDPISLVVSSQHDGRHAPEHGSGPGGLVIGMLPVPLPRLLAHPDIAGNIHRTDNFPIKNCVRDKCAYQQQEKDNTASWYQMFF